MGEKSRKFRELLATKPYVYTSGVYSPLQAKLAEMAGLDAVYMSGYSCALGYLGRADLGFPTMTEMTTWAKYIADVTTLPLIADADDGYGNALIAQRTVHEYERAGVAGIHLEDQRLPKRCGHLAGKFVLPIEESVKKLKAALDAKSDPDFFIIARTDAENAVGGDLDQAIERCKRFADVGADMVWPEFASPKRGPVERFVTEFRRSFPDTPLGFNYSSSFKWIDIPDPLTFDELAQMGFKYIFMSMSAIHASMYAEYEFLKDLKDNKEQAQWRLQRMKSGHPTENHHKIGDFERYQKLEEMYLPPDVMQERYARGTGFGAEGFTETGVL